MPKIKQTEGYLFKRQRYTRTWTRNYCILSNLGVLSYYNTEHAFHSNGQKRGEWKIKSATFWRGKKHGLFGSYIKNGLKLKTASNKRIFLYTDNASEFTRWCMALSCCGVLDENILRGSFICLSSRKEIRFHFHDIKQSSFCKLLQATIYQDCASTLPVQLLLYLPIESFSTYQQLSRSHDSALIKNKKNILKWYSRAGLIHKQHGCMKLYWWTQLRRHSSRNYSRMKRKPKKQIKLLWERRINTDVSRTFGEATSHKQNYPCRFEKLNDKEAEIRQKNLFDVLLKLAAQYPDVGYCQGLDTIVAYIQQVIQQDEEHVLRFICILFEDYHLKDLFLPGLHCLQIKCFILNQLLQGYLPDLMNHFEKENIQIDLFAIGWFQTIFLYSNALDNNLINHIWTIFFTEKSWKIFFRVAMAILWIMKDILMTLCIEGVVRLVHTLPADIVDRNKLIPIALSFEISQSLLEELEKKYHRVHCHLS